MQEVTQKVHLFFGIGGNYHKSITSNETRITVAIVDIIIDEVLSFNLSQKPRFKKVLELSSNVTKSYIPPTRNILSKELLDVI